ncbi:hypothetical protein AALP_AA8G040500 [Arabis alpina]|uniref:Enhancer of polycomb-like protein n=1 Tax=Arabis alpina TaxID=50452 RepID=A0A087G4V5_ARAAL|nr:hypothetical protein AALP_AA8G040500 [Arabis alpina]
MPSVGMRRTTRVFGVVKAADGARVLRSGRRIWPNVGEPKVRRAHDVVDPDWNSLLKNNNNNNKISGPRSPRQIISEKEEKEVEVRVTKRRKVRSEEVVGDVKSVDKLFGVVYSRKRKRLSGSGSSSSDRSERSLKFYRRRKRLSSDHVSSLGKIYRPLIALTVDLSIEDCWLSSVFGLVMRYVRREELRLSSLVAFFLSQTVKEVFAEHGVRFLAESPVSSRGVCKFFRGRSCLPLLSVDFSAIPRCFMDMHLTLFLRSFVFVKRSLHLLNNPVEESDSDSECELALSELCNLRNRGLVGLHPSVRASKLTGGNAQYRGNLGSHSFQKRRSSLRRRRARNLSHNNVHKLYNGTSVSDLSVSRKNRTVAVPSRKLRSSVVVNNTSPVSNGISVITKPKTKEELDSLCCSVNILTIHSDRCTREEGCSVMLEFSSSKEWFLVIKKAGVIRYSHTAQRTMRPCSTNRLTHAIVWMGDDNWKLEFCDRQDWAGFKDIYKECYERNVLEQSVKVIPIPGVREVYGYAEDIDDLPSFTRPVPYISLKEDEVSRAMARSIALYDMDSEDEEWLERRNLEMLGEEDEQQLHRDTFELMIDGFEKFSFHSHADDLLDEKAATIANLSHLGRQEVVEAVYEYWARKRKQRKAPLLRVFQGQQAKKTSLLSKTVFRKRRSFKRQGSQLNGKAKQQTPLLVAAKAAEQEASEEQNVLLRVEEAKAAAAKSMEFAIAKRRRAQLLAENADLAVYKAMMALRIAETIQLAESSEEATTLFLN